MAVLLNIIVNASILSSAFFCTPEHNGDLAEYKNKRRSPDGIKAYLLDYIVWNGGNVKDTKWVESISFDVLDEDEKTDMVFDILSLHMSGAIIEVSDEVKEYAECIFIEKHNICDEFINKRIKAYFMKMNNSLSNNTDDRRELETYSASMSVYMNSGIEEKIDKRMVMK